MDERDRRIAENERVFREVNERLDSLQRAFASVTDRVSLVCECGDGTCVAQVEMTTRDYEELRADPTQFAVVRGHDVGDLEQVVVSRDGYDVVRKRSVGARRLAAEQHGD